MKKTHTPVTSAARVRGLTVLQIFALSAKGAIPPLRKARRQMVVDSKALSDWCRDNPNVYKAMRKPIAKAIPSALYSYLEET